MAVMMARLDVVEFYDSYFLLFTFRLRRVAVYARGVSAELPATRARTPRAGAIVLPAASHARRCLH